MPQSDIIPEIPEGAMENFVTFTNNGDAITVSTKPEPQGGRSDTALTVELIPGLNTKNGCLCLACRSDYRKWSRAPRKRFKRPADCQSRVQDANTRIYKTTESR
ncbi:hypothetical protein FALCPG4_018326 [Fusarium falciforme]